MTDAINIMLIASTSSTARLIEVMLDLNGSAAFALEVQHNVPKALARLKARRVDVILLQLVGGTGLDAFTKIHGQDPEIPILIMTEPDQEARAIEAVKAGA